VTAEATEGPEPADAAPPRGTQDLLPPLSEAMLGLEEAAHDLARTFGFRYVETPAFEHTDLFERTSGAGSDVVRKEMYTFEDKGGRSLTLKPEATAPIVRAFLEHRQELPTPFKPYSVGPAWRHGRPQAGRLREFRVFDVEVIGTASPDADVEVVAIGDRYLRDRGLSRLTLHLNSIGDDACRPAYRERLVAYLRQHRDELSRDSRERIDVNPLRTFDSKEPRDRDVLAGAPLVSDALCDPCRDHFDAVRKGLDEQGIAYELDPRLVRGLDYYARTAFEFLSGVLSPAQSTVCGGGRYDGLAEILGGEPTPGVGFGLGLDRVLLALREEGAELPPPRSVDCYVVALGDAARRAARDLVRSLRDAGVGAEAALEERPLKAQLRMADRAGARYAALIGDRELGDGAATLRRLSDGRQEPVKLGEVASWLANH
jgi:histidyl-tRNA synthetase